MNERDELAKALFITDNHRSEDAAAEWEFLLRKAPKFLEAYHRMADAILAAGYRRPRTITTVEELNELPAETIVRDANGFTWDKWWDEDGNEYSWWATTGDRVQYSPKRVILPATVLHEPEPRP